MAIMSGAYFDVFLAGLPGVLVGNFMHVEGLGMELDYEVFEEGGANYPRYFLKGTKPMQLVLSRGVITGIDFASTILMATHNGSDTPLNGTIILRDAYGGNQREWTVVGAHLVKYVGPALDSNQPSLAVSQIVLIHNGCY